MAIKVALFHHTIGDQTAIGKILSFLAECLAKNGYEVTVFAQATYEQNHSSIKTIRTLIIKKPLFLMFLSYHITSLLNYFWHVFVKRETWDIKIGIESNFLFPDICYLHFCHRAYLRKEWKEVSKHTVWWLRFLRWLNHIFRALLESHIFRKARWIVVPSKGLANELLDEYPWVRDKVVVIHNFIDWNAMQVPEDFDRYTFRRKLGIRSEDIACVFAALGAFERKGLHHLLEALAKVDAPFKAVVVGGREHEIKEWKTRAATLGIEERVIFAGLQKDVRPYLWASDVFVFPSAKEIFPLSVLEAAAAGLPLIVTQLYGVEEFMRDGEMGYVVARDSDAIEEALLRFSGLSEIERQKMGQKSREVTRGYSRNAFCQHWVNFLETIGAGDE